MITVGSAHPRLINPAPAHPGRTPGRPGLPGLLALPGVMLGCPGLLGLENLGKVFLISD